MSFARTIKKTGPDSQGMTERPGELLMRTFADLRRHSVRVCAEHEPKFKNSKIHMQTQLCLHEDNKS